MDQDELLEAWPVCQGSLRHRASRYLRNEEDVKDAIQETFLRMYKNHAKIGDTVHLLRYAHTVLRNYCFDHYHQRGREYPYRDCAPTGTSQHFSPEAERYVLIREIQDAVDALMDDDYETIKSFCARDTLVAESRETGVAVTTIRSREQAALGRLREKLGLRNGDVSRSTRKL